MILFNLFLLMLLTWNGGESSREVTLSCGADDAIERGPIGAPGKRGFPGEQGIQGFKGDKGDPGENDGWLEVVRRLEERISTLEAQVQNKDCSGYTSLGCWRDCGPRSSNCNNRAIPTLEGTTPILDGSYGSRRNAIEKCARVARERGFPGFAIQNGGWCAGSANILSTYHRYGTQSNCGSDGEGGPSSNEVYSFNKC
ncbi:unnamed protein product [Clavelina lepadiformis]|uniref:Uncharacterized protein n=1 Tax=Clavelina lepadiformis TaxID=159417 RepID=A0ABP0FQX2_CLALP